ncbi:MAG TPA: tetratricopeptide repeat protein [Thermoanaerobaculia bacterium]
MMVERHYDDEALIALLAADRVRTDVHLPACTVCNEKLESFRTISGALTDNDVWDTRELRLDPVPSTIANLRTFADRMSAEDTEAARILPELLAGSREEWMPRLRAHPEWRTAGVVRALVAATTNVLMTMPPDALEMTALSTEIADHLDPATCGAATLARVRGAAWRDRGYALYYVGRFADSLAACETAARQLDLCVVDEYDRARVGVVRALSLRAMEDFGGAMTDVRSSANTFAFFQDAARLTAARIAEAHLLFSHHDYENATLLLKGLEQDVRLTTDASNHARILGNLGYSYWKSGRIDAALSHYEAAAAMLEDLGVRTESVRVRWNIAAVLASAGRTEEAMSRFRLLQRTFEELGMSSEAAVNSLEMAELLLARHEYAAVEAICRTAMASFERAGIPYTARALTALAYIQEAAQQRTATPKLAKHVREYIRRLPQEGELLFAPPPPEPLLSNSR